MSSPELDAARRPDERPPETLRDCVPAPRHCRAVAHWPARLGLFWFRAVPCAVPAPRPPQCHRCRNRLPSNPACRLQNRRLFPAPWYFRGPMRCTQSRIVGRDTSRLPRPVPPPSRTCPGPSPPLALAPPWRRGNASAFSARSRNCPPSSPPADSPWPRRPSPARCRCCRWSRRSPFVPASTRRCARPLR